MEITRLILLCSFRMAWADDFFRQIVKPVSTFCGADHQPSSFDKCEPHDPRNHWSNFAYNTGPPGKAVRLPGEFEPVDRLYLAFSSEWSCFQNFYVEIVQASHRQVAEIAIFVQANTAQADFENLVFALYEIGIDARNISFYHVELNSAWVRDYGPLFVQNEHGETSIVDMRYIGIRLRDDMLPTSMGYWWSVSVYRLPLELVSD